MDRLAFVSHVCATVGCGLMAGLFFAFSVSIMNGLGRLPGPQGIAAMQSINVAIVNPVFLLVFLGTTVACLVLGVATLFTTEPSDTWRLVAALLYLLGAFGVTVIFNVPLNNALAAVDPASADGARLWEQYSGTWTAWNHVRTLACTGALIALVLAR